MHRSLAEYPFQGLAEPSELTDSASGPSSPLPMGSSNHGVGVDSPPAAPPQGLPPNVLPGPPEARATSHALSTSMSYSRDATVAPTAALARKIVPSAWLGLRRPKPVPVRRATAVGPLSPGRATTVTSPVALQMVSPLSGALSRQTSMVNQSRVGLRGPAGVAGYQLPLSPTSSALDATAGTSRRVIAGNDVARRRVGPLTSGTTGNQMGRNLDSRVYLQTHVASGGQRLLYSPSHMTEYSTTTPVPLPGKTAVVQTRVGSGIPSAAPDRGTPLVGVLGGTPSSSNLPSLTHVSGSEMASCSALVAPAGPSTGVSSRRAAVGVTDSAGDALYTRQASNAQQRRTPSLLRPTSPFSVEPSTRTTAQVATHGDSAVGRVLSGGGGQPHESSTVRRVHTGGVAETAASWVPATGSTTSSFPQHSPPLQPPSGAPLLSAAQGDVARRTQPSPPPVPSPFAFYASFQPNVEPLKEQLLYNASPSGRLDFANAAATNVSVSGTPIPHESVGGEASERASRLTSPTLDPLTSVTRLGAASVTEAAPRRRGVFGLFGLLERNSRFEELYGLYNGNTALRELLSGIKAQVAVIAHRERLPGMARAFNTIFFLIENSQETVKVGLEYYRNPMIAWPLTVLYLVSCYWLTARRYGFVALHEAIRNSGGLLAMGKGLFAALAVAMSDSEESLPLHTARMMCASFTLGVIMRRRLDAWETHMKNSLSRSFSYLLVNIPTSTLRQLVDEVNECRGIDLAAAKERAKQTVDKEMLEKTAGASTLSGWRNDGDGSTSDGQHTPDVLPRTHLEVSRVISSRSAVVCGHPLDLDRLDIVLTRYANSTGVKIHKDFIPACAPENSSYYNEDMVFELLACWQYSHTTFDPADLYVPLFSPVQGERWEASTLRSPDAFAKLVAEAVTYRNQDLTYSLQHIADGDYLLDFTTLPLTMGAVVEWTNKQFDIISVPINRREHAILPPPRRSQQPSGVRGTLLRLAMINAVLDELVREGGITLSSVWRAEVTESTTRRRGESGVPNPVRLASGVELSTTFEDLGLVLYVKNQATYHALARAKARRERAEAAQSRATTTPQPAEVPPLPRRSNAVTITHEGVAAADSADGTRTSSQPVRVASSSLRSGSGEDPLPSHSIGSTLVEMVGSSSRSGGGDTVVPALSCASTRTDVSELARQLPDGFVPPPLLKRRPDSVVELVGLEEDTDNGLPVILDADDTSAATSPVRPPVRPLPRGVSTSHLEDSEAQLFSTSLARRPSGVDRARAHPPLRSQDKLYKSDFVVQQNAFLDNVVNIYQVSPVVRYYEMQFGCVLCAGAIAFTERLRKKTGVEFPPYLLLMCPTIFSLLELWDGYEFINQCCRS